MNETIRQLWCRHRATIAAAFAVLLAYAVMALAGIGCPLKFFSGISCPGCGMTRAFLHACRLELAEAFSYHPLWVAVLPTAALLLVFRRRRNQTAFYTVLICAAVLMLAVYAWRIAFSCGGVVVCEPQNGFFGRCVRGLLAFSE